MGTRRGYEIILRYKNGRVYVNRQPTGAVKNERIVRILEMKSIF